MPLRRNTASIPMAIRLCFCLRRLSTLRTGLFAGVEPADLPEDIEVTDRRKLVGSNHARRRAHRVVA